MLIEKYVRAIYQKKAFQQGRLFTRRDGKTTSIPQPSLSNSVSEDEFVILIRKIIEMDPRMSEQAMLLVLATIASESGFSPGAENKSYNDNGTLRNWAIGIPQVMVSTFHAWCKANKGPKYLQSEVLTHYPSLSSSSIRERLGNLIASHKNDLAFIAWSIWFVFDHNTAGYVKAGAKGFYMNHWGGEGFMNRYITSFKASKSDEIAFSRAITLIPVGSRISYSTFLKMMSGYLAKVNSFGYKE